MSQIKFIAQGVKWRDKVNGNTYHSVRVTRCKDGETIAANYQYGYGDHWKDTAKLLMRDNGWIPKKYNGQLYLYERENDYPIFWTVREGTKRDCMDHGEL